MPPTNGPTVDIPAAPNDLTYLCSLSDTNTEGAMDQCTEACFQATCCWKTETITTTNPEGDSVTKYVAGECSQQPDCIAYSACSTLEDNTHSPAIATDSPAPAPAPVTNAPGPDSGSTVEITEQAIFDLCYNHIEQPGAEETMCEQVCKPGSCCYTIGETCAEGFDCTKYGPCNKLAEGESGTGVANAVKTACIDSDDLADCVELCGHSACCFTFDPSKSCDMVNPDLVCSEYEDCEVLY
jgi:hypothetical protein